jgi:hypothetical protein
VVRSNSQESRLDSKALQARFVLLKISLTVRYHLTIAVRALTSNKSQNERHDSEHGLQVAAQHTPDDGNDNYGDSRYDGEGSELIGPKAFHEFEAVLTLITPVKLRKKIHPLMVWADLLRVVICYMS